MNSELKKQVDLYKKLNGVSERRKPEDMNRRGFFSVKQLADEAGLSDTTVQARMFKMVRAGLADCEDALIGRHRTKFYRIKES